MSYTCNAVIERAEITIDRGFILTAWLQLSYGGMGQGFGGYSLFLGKTSKHHESSKERNFAGIFIHGVMDIAGVESWNGLVGKTIRVEKTDEWGSIIRIGHIVHDKWFDPKVELETTTKKRET